MSNIFECCVRGSAAALLTLGLAACVSMPVSRITLPPPTPPDQIEDAATRPALLLRSVSLPSYLDGDRIVVESDGTRTRRAQGAAWAGRLADGVKHTLRDALAQRLGAAHVRAADDDVAAEAELSVDFLALDPTRGAVHLDAVWLMTCRASGGGVLGRVWLDVPLAAQTPKAIAAATSEALSELADELAPTLQCELAAEGLFAARPEEGASWRGVS